jgi:hypothetical protein
MSAPPLAFRWDGEAMQPLRPDWADQRFVIGQIYALESIEERSPNSHRHYFAALREAWANLNEADARRFPNPEALRKFALISCGYADQRQIVASSKAQAETLAAFLGSVVPYALVTIEERVVTVFTARSQSRHAMPKAQFAESKDRVLGFVSGMIGVTPDDLGRANAA